MIKGTNVSLTYPASGQRSQTTVLNNVDFTIEAGRITSFIGKSGAGKTSLLKSVATLVPSFEGSIIHQGNDVRSFTPRQRVTHIGYVFQQFNLFPHMTVLENCMHPQTSVLGTKMHLAKQKAMDVLQSLSLKKQSHAYPRHLSGGQQQRAAIARALCMDPEVMLFDEPTSSLDPESTRALKDIIHALQKRGITIALSSHDMPFIRSILDRVYFLKDGRIVDAYDAKTDTHPSAGPIADFLELE